MRKLIPSNFDSVVPISFFYFLILALLSATAKSGRRSITPPIPKENKDDIDFILAVDIPDLDAHETELHGDSERVKIGELEWYNFKVARLTLLPVIARSTGSRV